jgi:hypothetical protein
MQSQTFIAACEKAGALVAQLPDQNYRNAAFQVALERLLAEDANSPQQGPAIVPRKPADGGSAEVKSDTQRRILELRDGGFFREPHLPGDVQNELRTQGFHHNGPDVRMALLRLAKKKMLRRIQEQGNQYRYANI